MDSVMSKRAVLGLQLSNTGTLRDTLGVFVSRVTPKGPAETAGIVEGDRIVSINGIDLRVNAADAGDSYASDLPSRRLTREVAKLTPGTAVNLRVNSGGRIRDVRVTTGRASDFREGGFFGLLGDGPNTTVFRNMPDFEGLRVPLERLRTEIPRMKYEQFNLPRMREEMIAPRIHVEGMPRFGEGIKRPRVWVESGPGLRDGESRIRIYTPRGDGEYRTYIVSPDGELRLDPNAKSKDDRDKIEKKESQKKKSNSQGDS
jgi:hypothetical protein